MKLPRISFGASGIAGMYNAVSVEQGQDVLQTAWDSGLRFFDVAPHYGQGLAERRLGDFLRNKPSSEWILSTKVGRILTPSKNPVAPLNGFQDPLPFDQHYDYSYDGIMRSVEDSFQRLGVNKIDIVFVHDIGDVTHGKDAPKYFEQLTTTGHKALSQLKAEGTIQAIGLGVNEVEVCEALIDKMEMDLILLAGRYTLLEQVGAKNLMERCREHDVRLVIGGVFNSGILATGAVEGAHYNYQLAPTEIMERVAKIEKVCAHHNVPLVAAALVYPERNDLVASTLIGTAKSSSLTRNMDLLKLSIPEQLWTDLAADGLIENV